MKYKVDGWNNFLRVFRLPKRFSNEFCFGAGIPTDFRMVDWFNALPDLDSPAVSKGVWRENVGEYKTTEIDIDELEKIIVPFVKKKNYYDADYDYLILFNFGASIFISKETK